MFSAGGKEGELDSGFPGDLEGEWRLEVELRREEETVASGSASLLRSSGAAIHLSINRTIANRLDRMEVDLMTAAGEEEQEVALAAVLILPDESQLILPGLFERQAAERLENPVFLARGVLEDSQVELLNRYLGDFGEGLYQVSVKMNDLESGSLLALGSASFQVCDTPARVTGTVTEGGQPLGGEGTLTAGVSAEDLDDGFVMAQAEIGEDGSYQLELAPGRYRLTAAVPDAEGVHLGEFGEIVTIGCEGEGQEANIETELVSEVDSNEVKTSQSPQSVTTDRRIVPQQGGGSIPMPTVVIWFGYSGDPQYKQDAEISYNTTFRPNLNVPGVIFGFNSAGRSDYSMDVGMSGQEQGDQGKFKYEVKLRPICGGQSRTLVSQTRSGSSALGEMTVLAAEAAMAINAMPNLAQDLDTDRSRPVAPKLELVHIFPNDRPAPGATIGPLLSAKDADGTTREGLDFKMEIIKRLTGGGTNTLTVTGLTDEGGAFDPDLVVAQDEQEGAVTGLLDRCGNVERSNTRYYYVQGQGGGQALRLADPPPPYDVTASVPVMVTFEALILNSPAPLVDIGVVQSTGSLSSTTITTGSDGKASVTYTPPATNGNQYIIVSILPPEGDNIFIPFNVTGAPDLAVSAAGAPQPLPLDAGHSLQGGNVVVRADLRIGVDPVESQLVVFSLQGPGQLTSTNGQTDEFGVVTTGFIPPDGAGTTTVTGTSIVNGVTISDSVDIEYEEGFTATHLGGIATDNSFGGTWPFPSRLNDLGQVVGHRQGFVAGLWLPEPAYGLSAGLNPLNGCPNIEPDGQGAGGSGCTGRAWGINNSGQILLNEILWANGSGSSLDHVFGGYHALNSQGQIVGWDRFEVNGTFPTFKAFRTTAGGAREILEPGAGYDTSAVLGHQRQRRCGWTGHQGGQSEEPVGYVEG